MNRKPEQGDLFSASRPPRPAHFALHGRTREIDEQFERFHDRHPEVYAELVRICRAWRSRGQDHWSIDAAYHVVRFERRMAGLPDAGELFKLNNNHTSRYSRLIMAQEADLSGIFETRVVRA